MRQLSWAIVVSASLYALSATGSHLGYVLDWGGIRTVMGLLPFWSWLITLVVLVLAVMQLWRATTVDTTRGFDVVSGPK